MLKQKAIKLGAIDLQPSNRLYKKYYVLLPSGQIIHFGDNRYDDFTTHKDPIRRLRYRARASKIKDKYGRLTFKLRTSPNYWSYNLLW